MTYPCQSGAFTRWSYCGEKYFEAKVLKQIEKEFFAIQNGKKIPHEISVPVEDFRKLQIA